MQRELEGGLINLGKSAIRGVQLIGYLPLSIQRSSSRNSLTFLNFRVSSVSVTFTILLLLFTLGWECNYAWNRKSYVKFVAVFGQTEKYAHGCFVIITSLMGIYFRVSGLSQGKKTLEFWKDCCQTMEKVQQALGYFKEDMLEENEFRKIKVSLTRSILLNMSCIGIHIVVVHGYRLYRTLTDETNYWSTDSEFHVGSGFWFFLVLFHVMNSIWLSFFIKLYTASFTCLSNRIQKLKELNEFSGIIYVSEIIGMKKALGIGRESIEATTATSTRNSMKMLEIQLTLYINAFTMLERQVERFNKFFGGNLIAEMIVCIINLVVHSFFISLWLGRNVWRQVAMIIVPFSVFATQLYRLGSVGGEMTLAAESVSTALFESVPFGQLCTEMRFKVQMIAMKIVNGPPVISASHFFIVNRHLVTSVLSAMTTFLVVLVQFRDADNTF